MLQTIGAAIFVTAVFGTKPIARAVERVADIVSARKQDKAARRKAMEDYLSRDSRYRALILPYSFFALIFGRYIFLSYNGRETILFDQEVSNE